LSKPPPDLLFLQIFLPTNIIRQITKLVKLFLLYFSKKVSVFEKLIFWGFLGGLCTCCGETKKKQSGNAPFHFL